MTKNWIKEEKALRNFSAGNQKDTEIYHYADPFRRGMQSHAHGPTHVQKC